jgi:hypothetical protein
MIDAVRGTLSLTTADAFFPELLHIGVDGHFKQPSGKPPLTEWHCSDRPQGVGASGYRDLGLINGGDAVHLEANSHGSPISAAAHIDPRETAPCCRHRASRSCPDADSQSLRICAAFLPSMIRFRHADGAWPVAGGNRGGLVGEEDSVPYIVAFRDPSQSAGAIEAPIALQPPMSTQFARLHAEVGTAVGAYQPVKLLLRHLPGSRSLWAGSFE